MKLRKEDYKETKKKKGYKRRKEVYLGRKDLKGGRKEGGIWRKDMKKG